MATILDWIEAKRLGRELDAASLRSLVSRYTSGDIPDYQMSAWLMAVTLNGMSLDETCALTDAMVASGDTLDLAGMPGPTLDKHSSGGVGDKVTLALVPILAADGAYLAKMSGHGLGLTGGTLDKLASVPGIRTRLSDGEILKQVREVGACVCAQSDTLAPADRAIYALRDVTGTVASIPLIASSIMSKKLACSAAAILLDIKVGTGAFMQEIDEAVELAAVCVAIAQRHRKRVTAAITDMGMPLGRAVGNAIEMREAAALIKPGAADGERRLVGLTSALRDEAARLAGWPETTSRSPRSGGQFEKLARMLQAQGGDWTAFATDNPLDDIEADMRTRWSAGAVLAERSGYVSALDARKVAETASLLGAHRLRKGDEIDYEAGIWLSKTVGEPVEAGEPLAWLNSSDPSRIDERAKAALLAAYTFSDECPAAADVVIKVLRSGGNDTENSRNEAAAR